MAAATKAAFANSCDLTCYEFCEVQRCEASSCLLDCSDGCNQSCSGGACNLSCYEDCDQSCSGGGCELTCYENCSQECTGEQCNMSCYDGCTQVCGAAICRMTCDGGESLCDRYCADGTEPQPCGDSVYSCGGACP